jgi:23S rRNA-intervening sequence protein
MSEKISSFKDLRVYKLAFELQQEIFETSKRFPAEERYALTDQVRRASRSIGANLAEASREVSLLSSVLGLRSSGLINNVRHLRSV